MTAKVCSFLAVRCWAYSLTWPVRSIPVVRVSISLLQLVSFSLIFYLKFIVECPNTFPMSVHLIYGWTEASQFPLLHFPKDVSSSPGVGCLCYTIWLYILDDPKPVTDKASWRWSNESTWSYQRSSRYAVWRGKFPVGNHHSGELSFFPSESELFFSCHFWWLGEIHHQNLAS